MSNRRGNRELNQDTRIQNSCSCPGLHRHRTSEVGMTKGKGREGKGGEEGRKEAKKKESIEREMGTHIAAVQQQ